MQVLLNCHLAAFCTVICCTSRFKIYRDLYYRLRDLWLFVRPSLGSTYIQLTVEAGYWVIGMAVSADDALTSKS